MLCQRGGSRGVGWRECVAGRAGWVGPTRYAAWQRGMWEGRGKEVVESGEGVVLGRMVQKYTMPGEQEARYELQRQARR